MYEGVGVNSFMSHGCRGLGLLYTRGARSRRLSGSWERKGGLNRFWSHTCSR